MDSLVASGRLQPEDAGLLHRDILQAEKRGASRAGTGIPETPITAPVKAPVRVFW